MHRFSLHMYVHARTRVRVRVDVRVCVDVRACARVCGHVWGVFNVRLYAYQYVRVCVHDCARVNTYLPMCRACLMCTALSSVSRVGLLAAVKLRYHCLQLAERVSPVLVRRRAGNTQTEDERLVSRCLLTERSNNGATPGKEVSCKMSNSGDRWWGGGILKIVKNSEKSGEDVFSNVKQERRYVVKF